jgi:hypothetical protein
LDSNPIYSAAFDFRTFREQRKDVRHRSDSQIAVFSDMGMETITEFDFILIFFVGTWGDVVGFIDFLAKAIDVELAFHLGDLSYGTSEEVWNK